MSYNRRTWADRLSEFPARRRLRFTDGETEYLVDVSREEGAVHTEGDMVNAASMNDLEGRIAEEMLTLGQRAGKLEEGTATLGKELDSLAEKHAALAGHSNDLAAGLAGLASQADSLGVNKAEAAALAAHEGSRENPHAVTFAQIGALGEEETAADSLLFGGEAPTHYASAHALAEQGEALGTEIDGVVGELEVVARRAEEIAGGVENTAGRLEELAQGLEATQEDVKTLAALMEEASADGMTTAEKVNTLAGALAGALVELEKLVPLGGEIEALQGEVVSMQAEVERLAGLVSGGSGGAYIGGRNHFLRTAFWNNDTTGWVFTGRVYTAAPADLTDLLPGLGLERGLSVNCSLQMSFTIPHSPLECGTAHIWSGSIVPIVASQTEVYIEVAESDQPDGGWMILTEHEVEIDSAGKGKRLRFALAFTPTLPYTRFSMGFEAGTGGSHIVFANMMLEQGSTVSDWRASPNDYLP